MHDPASLLLAAYYMLGFPGGSDGKESACSVGDLDSIPGSGRSPGEGNGNLSSIFAWRIPWMEEPGGYSPWGRKESDTTERLHFHFLSLSKIYKDLIQLNKKKMIKKRACVCAR